MLEVLLSVMHKNPLTVTVGLVLTLLAGTLVALLVGQAREDRAQALQRELDRLRRERDQL